ncbi:AAA family ATPase [Alistipes sp.]|jgi:putative ATP-dependent endonuclease of OLD family|uniref:ATP-dependent nuclease n=1 Tax=unclassified Alistipes TaxID=2608932 RepID=UPI00307E671C
MAKLRYLRIRHFRGIESFEQTFSDGITCIIGRGDTCKSTILDAIAYVFAQSWSLRLNDSDFYMCDASSPIIIEGVVSDVPDDLVAKYSNHLRGITTDGRLIDDMESDEAIDAQEVLTVRLTIGRDLEPLWEVVSYNGIEPSIIKATDRGKLNVYMVSDYIERHFSLNKVTPLYSLYRQLCGEYMSDNENLVLDVVRDAKNAFDANIGDRFNGVIEKIRAVSEELGITLNEMKAMLDHRDIAISENKVSIHEDGIPFRLKGKGSKRILSLAIQLALTQPSGIILIDEIEQGLEPDRVQHLANRLSQYTDKQVIITTHSSNVIIEIPCTSLFILRKGASCLQHIKGELQGCIRKNPEAFFAKRTLVCEGATEVGFCRSLNQFRIHNTKISAACRGVRFVDGTGNEMVNYVLGFNALSYPTALLCDSDNTDINKRKKEFNDIGIKVIDCEEPYSIEQQVFNDVPWNVVKELIQVAVRKIAEDDGVSNKDAEKRIFDSTNANLQNKIAQIENWCDNESIELRQALGTTAKNKDWYKRQTYGELMGDCILSHYSELSDGCRLKSMIDALSTWIDE